MISQQTNSKSLPTRIFKIILTSILTITSITSFILPTPSLASSNSNITQQVNKKLSELKSKMQSLSPKILKLALESYYHAKAKGLVKKPYLTVIDYADSSAQKRLWVIDMRHDKVPFYTYVAHGKGTGMTYAKHFSNRSGSRESSLGTFITAHTYYGHKGLSLRIKGLEPGVNDHAYQRAVVIHGAWYVSKNFVHKYHRLGRSWGCPALSRRLVKPIINTIKNGSVVFAYYPDQHWLHNSAYVDV